MKKKHFIILTILAVTVIFGYLGFNKINSNFEALRETTISEVEPASVADGTYPGAYSLFPISVEVSVTVYSGMITEIEITKHDNGQGEPAEAIIETVIDMQSVQFDAIAGATYSSIVILLAISDALNGE